MKSKHWPERVRTRIISEEEIWRNFDQFVQQWGWAYDKPIIYFAGIAYAFPWTAVGVLSGVRGQAEFED